MPGVLFRPFPRRFRLPGFFYRAPVVPPPASILRRERYGARHYNLLRLGEMTLSPCGKAQSAEQKRPVEALPLVCNVDNEQLHAADSAFGSSALRSSLHAPRTPPCNSKPQRKKFISP